MGANLSAEEEVIVKLLIQLLIKRGVNYDPYKVKLLLKFLQKNGAPSTVLVVFDVKTWENAGTTTWDAASRGDTTAAEVMMTWHLVTETLRSWQVEKLVQTAATQATQAGEIKSGDCVPPEKANLDRLGKRQTRYPQPMAATPRSMPLRSSASPSLPPTRPAALPVGDPFDP